MYLGLERLLKCLTSLQYEKKRSSRMKHLHLFQTLSFLHQVPGKVVALRLLRTLPLVHQQQTLPPFHLRHLPKKKTSTYALLTKREVKMAGLSSHLDRTSLVNKGFIIWLYLQVKTTTAKQNRTRNCSTRKEILHSRPVQDLFSVHFWISM